MQKSSSSKKKNKKKGTSSSEPVRPAHGSQGHLGVEIRRADSDNKQQVLSLVGDVTGSGKHVAQNAGDDTLLCTRSIQASANAGIAQPVAATSIATAMTTTGQHVVAQVAQIDDEDSLRSTCNKQQIVQASTNDGIAQPFAAAFITITETAGGKCVAQIANDNTLRGTCDKQPIVQASTDVGIFQPTAAALIDTAVTANGQPVAQIADDDTLRGTCGRQPIVQTSTDDGITQLTAAASIATVAATPSIEYVTREIDCLQSNSSVTVQLHCTPSSVFNEEGVLSVDTDGGNMSVKTVAQIVTAEPQLMMEVTAIAETVAATSRATHTDQNAGKAASKVSTKLPAVDVCSGMNKTLTAATDGGSAAQYTDGGSSGMMKSKAELRAERRAIQEAQRAAKAAGKQSGGTKELTPKPVKTVDIQPASMSDKKALAPKVSAGAGTQLKKPDLSTTTASAAKDSGKVRVSERIQADDDRAVKRQSRKLDRQNVPRRNAANQKKVSLFKHLMQYEHKANFNHRPCFNSTTIHPAILRLGTKYMEGIISGSNARCIALLMAMKEVIADYRTPPNKELCRDLEVHIRPCISYLNECRLMSVSMGNAIKYVKHQITHMSSTEPDDQARESLQLAIDDFIHRVRLAMQSISNSACCKIQDGDTLLVYACSSLLVKVLCDAHAQGKQFRVIIADGRPKLEGRVMLRRLVQSGISCTYILINAVSYVMKEVTKVLLGAHALLANGSVMSRVGSSQVALTAKFYNIPVLVCCETYKFCERVQTDSFVFNELGDPRDVMTVNGATNVAMLDAWQNNSDFHVLNLVYDVTPADLVSMVITEIGMIPCTSVPVVLRVKCTDLV